MKTIIDFLPDIERAKTSKTVLLAIHAILRGHVGAENSTRGTNLLTALNRAGHHIDHRRMRLAISTLRRQGVLICSAPGRNGGYYMPESRDEFESFLHTEYLAKIADMTETLHAMQAAAARQFTPQQLDLL